MMNVNGKIYPDKKVIVTEDGTYKKPSIAGGTVAGVAGLTVAAPIAKFAPKPFQKMAVESIKDIGGDSFKKAAELAFEKSGLKERGVHFIDAATLDEKAISQITKEALPKWVKKLPKKVQDGVIAKVENQIRAMKSGSNACFVFNADKILVSGDKMSGASFHEMGHALNKHSSKIGRILQKLRGPGMVLAPLALLIGAFKPKQAEGQEPKNAVDRFTTFVKNNAGKLAFAGFIPTLLEEGMASIRGSKLAKPLLSPEMHKNLNKMHGKAFLTYLGTAVGVGLAARAASWIHDKISSPKKIA